MTENRVEDVLSKEVSLLSLIAADNFIVINRDLIKILGLKGAVLFGEFCSEQNYYNKKENSEECLWFFSTQENIQDKTGLSPYEQRETIKLLIEKGLIETKKQGIPCKNYYRVCLEQVVKNFNNWMSKNFTTGCQKISHLINSNKDNSNNNSNKIKETSISSSKEESIEVKRFTKPTIKEVKQYIQEQKFSLSAEEFCDYYESVGWVVGGKKKMKDWKAAVRLWESREKKGGGSKTYKTTRRQNNFDTLEEAEKHYPKNSWDTRYTEFKEEEDGT